MVVVGSSHRQRKRPNSQRRGLVLPSLRSVSFLLASPGTVT